MFSACTTLTVANPTNLNRDCGFFTRSCGDGFKDPNEFCDPTAPGQPANWRTDCTACGDGVAQADETCDPANVADPNRAICRPASANGPGQDAECTYCGDNLVQNPAPGPFPNEQCDRDGANCDPANPTAGCTCSTACLPCAPVTLGDFIWNDVNRNGIQDAGEAGIPNVAVQIQDCSGNTITTVTTNASGRYEYTQTLCEPNSLNLAISVDANQAALTGYVHTQVGVGSDTTDSDCGKGSNANTSQCTTLTVANRTGTHSAVTEKSSKIM